MLQVRAAAPRAETISAYSVKDAPVTEEGFEQVSKSCCYKDMTAYIRRLVENMGLRVCDEGGLSGIAPFYSCPQSQTSLAELKEELNKATPSFNNKCHWLANRYEQCTEPALECAVMAQKPPPAPEPVASGFIGLRVTNPAELVRSSKAIDVLKTELALSLKVPTSVVNIVIGVGPLNGEESNAQNSLFQVFHVEQVRSRETSSCEVFAVYSIQEPAPKSKSKKTELAKQPKPLIDEEEVAKKLKKLDTDAFGERLAADLATVDTAIGKVDVMETSTCEKSSGLCTHEVIKERNFCADANSTVRVLANMSSNTSTILMNVSAGADNTSILMNLSDGASNTSIHLSAE